MKKDSKLENRGVTVLLNVWAGDDHHALDWSISSIYRQTQPPQQLVVVVDGPISVEIRQTLEAKLEKASFPIALEYLPKNRGLSYARNVGISLSDNDLIAIHDADDIMHPDRLRIQTAFFKTQRLSILGTEAYEFDVDSKLIVGRRRTVVDRPLTLRDMWISNPVQHSSVLMSRDAVSLAGMYQTCPGAEDLHLWRRVVRTGASVMNLSRVLQALGTSTALLTRRQLTAAVLHGETQLLLDQMGSANLSEILRAPASFILRNSYRLIPISFMRVFYNKFLRERDEHLLTLESFLRNPAPTTNPESRNF